MSAANYEGMQVSNTPPSQAGGQLIDNNFRRIASWYRAPNFLINGDLNFFSRDAGNSTSYADNTMCGADQWRVLTQTAAINTSQVSPASQTFYSNYALQLSQAQASAQRMGVVQWIENINAVNFRGLFARFQFQCRCSNTTTIRYAIVGWTGTADSITTDLVLDWTSATYTAGNFFTTTSTTIIGTGSTAVTGSTWTQCSVEASASISTSVNNIAVFIWTDSTQAQNSTLQINQAGLYPADSTATAQGFNLWYPGDIGLETLRCQRYICTNVPYGTAPANNVAINESMLFMSRSTNTVLSQLVQWPVRMRVSPTVTFYSTSNANTAGQWGWYNTGSSVYTAGSSTASDGQSALGMRQSMSTSGLTGGQVGLLKGCFLADASL